MKKERELKKALKVLKYDEMTINCLSNCKECGHAETVLCKRTWTGKIKNPEKIEDIINLAKRVKKPKISLKKIKNYVFYFSIGILSTLSLSGIYGIAYGITKKNIPIILINGTIAVCSIIIFEFLGLEKNE